MKIQKFQFKLGILVLILSIGLISLWPYFNNHYSIDCYRDLYLIDEQYFLSSVAGRPLTWGLIKLLVSINLSPVYNQQLFFIIAILIFALGISLITKKILKYWRPKKDLFKAILAVLVASSVFNIFTTEVFQFNTFLIVQSLAFFFVALAIYLFDENLNPKRILGTTILLVISLSFYQSWIPFFVIYAGLISILFFKNPKKSYIKILLLYFISLGLNFIYIGLIHPTLWPEIASTNRLVGIDLKSNILSVLRYFKELWLNSLNMFPPLMFLVFTSVSYLFKPYFKKSLIYLGIIIFSLFFGIILHTFTKDIWFSQRSTMIIGAIPFLLLIFVFLNLNNIKGLPYNLFLLLSGFMIFFQIVFMNIIGLDLLKNNQMEMLEANSILNQIQEYEDSTGIKITNINFANDKNPQQSYAGVRQSLDVNVRALTRSWSFIGLIKKYTTEDLTFNRMTIQERDLIFENEIMNPLKQPLLKYKGDNAFVLIN